jgi:hypothetical protein
LADGDVSSWQGGGLSASTGSTVAACTTMWGDPIAEFEATDSRQPARGLLASSEQPEALHNRV